MVIVGTYGFYAVQSDFSFSAHYPVSLEASCHPPWRKGDYTAVFDSEIRLRVCEIDTMAYLKGGLVLGRSTAHAKTDLDSHTNTFPVYQATGAHAGSSI